MKKLVFRWSKKEKDWEVDWPDYPSNGSFLMQFFMNNIDFIDELERRGYDPKTIRFEVNKK